VVSATVRSVKRSSNSITVTGSAKRLIRSDYIVWRGSLSAQNVQLSAGYQELKRNGDRVRQFLTAHHVPDSSVAFGAIESYSVPEVTDNGRETGRTLAYRLTQSFEIRSAQVDSIAQLSRSTGELISEGVPLNSSPPEYLFTRLSEMRMEMLAQATEDAKNRAEKIAHSAGSRIGPVRSARMGVFQLTPRYSTDVSDYGIYDTSSLEKDITAVVSVSFAVD
jgi:hypothetical protein